MIVTESFFILNRIPFIVVLKRLADVEFHATQFFRQTPTRMTPAVPSLVDDQIARFRRLARQELRRAIERQHHGTVRSEPAVSVENELNVYLYRNGKA